MTTRKPVILAYSHMQSSLFDYEKSLQEASRKESCMWNFLKSEENNLQSAQFLKMQKHPQEVF